VAAEGEGAPQQLVVGVGGDELLLVCMHVCKYVCIVFVKVCKSVRKLLMECM
jgi:hypothetical protein